MARVSARREVFIPANFTEKREGPTKGTEIYLYTDAKGRPCAKGFRGRAQKSTFHHHYKSEEGREASLARWIAAEEKDAKAKLERRDKMSRPHSLKIGDILSSSWGYEQTNVDFYEVTALPSKFFVELTPIAKELDDSGNLSMQGYVSGLKGNYTGEPFRKRPDAENVVTLTSYSFARPWDGKPKHTSWYA